MLELIFVAVVLLVGATLASVMQENVSGNTEFSLPFGGIILTTIVGVGVFLLWGWTATLILLGAYWAWCLVGGLLVRAESRRKPP